MNCDYQDTPRCPNKGCMHPHGACSRPSCEGCEPPRLVAVIGSKTAFYIVAGITVALALLILGAHLDGNAEQATADSALDARADGLRSANRDAVAMQLCTDELGPGTRVLWTPDGDLVCRPFSLPIASN